MKNIVVLIFLLFLIAVRCNQDIKKDNDVEIEFRLINKRTILVNIENLSNSNIYIPEIRYIQQGISIYEIVKNNEFIDIGDSVFINPISLNQNDPIFKKCYKDYNNQLPQNQRDSIAGLMSNNMISKRKIDYISSLLKQAIFLKPKESYNKYFVIPKLESDKISLFYMYPYSHAKAKKWLLTSLGAEKYKQHMAMMDTLNTFSYPLLIDGYKLYSKPISHKPVILKLEK
jgi:hypothetical protein